MKKIKKLSKKKNLQITKFQPPYQMHSLHSDKTEAHVAST